MSKGLALEKEIATYSSILAWKIPWNEEPGGLHPWSHKELDATEHMCTHRCAYWHWGEAGGADPILQMKRAKLKVKSQIKVIELGHKLRPFQSRVQILSTCSPVSL